MVRVGQMNERVAIQNKTEANSDNSLRDKHEWPTVQTVWASVEALNSMETKLENLTVADVVWKVQMRRNENVNHTSRLLWGSKELYVSSVTSDNWYSVCLCREEE